MILLEFCWTLLVTVPPNAYMWQSHVEIKGNSVAYLIASLCSKHHITERLLMAGLICAS